MKPLYFTAGLLLLAPYLWACAEPAPVPEVEQPTRALHTQNIKEMKPELDLAKYNDSCGDMLYFDFGSAVDGAAYYTDRGGNIISTCGGCGMMPRDMQKKLAIPCGPCPPEGWTCRRPKVTVDY